MIHPAATDITELLKQLINLLQPIAQSHGIVLRLKPNIRKLVLFIRPDVVIMDITSLICNIISYTPRGTPSRLQQVLKRKNLRYGLILRGSTYH